MNKQCAYCGTNSRPTEQFQRKTNEQLKYWFCGHCIAKLHSNYVPVNLKEDDEMAQSVLPPREGFKFGCDPELFVKNAEGVYVSAAGLIPGTKDQPYEVEGGAVQVDGMAAEFNINPAADFKEFDGNIKRVLEQLQAMLPEGHTLDAVPAVTFSPDVFDNAPDVAKELGCSPDFNAWTGEVNMPPHDPDNPYLRTASGHLHIGWTEDADLSDAQHLMNCRDLVKQLDWYLGGWSIKIDSDPTRRRLYGKAGACRYKSYGVEYRVLGNFWVMDRNKRLTVWNRMQQAIADMSAGAMSDRVQRGYNDMLVEQINTCTKSMVDSTFRFPLQTLNTAYRAI